VIGWHFDRFPAFYVRDSGRLLTTVMHTAGEIAAAFTAAGRLGHPGGLLVANPIPAASELEPESLFEAVATVESEARRRGLSGGAVTPFVLNRLAELTGGATVEANVALAVSNAAVAAAIAVALAAAGNPGTVGSVSPA